MDKNKILLLITDGMSNAEYKSITRSNNILSQWKIVSLRYSDLYDFLNYTNKDISFNEELKKVIKIFQQKRNNYKGVNDYIFNNNYLDFQFEGINAEVNSSYTLSRIFSQFLDLLKPHAIVFGHDAFTRERFLVNVAKKKGIITLGLLHSGLGFKFAYRGIVGNVDYVLVWNKIDKDYLLDFGISLNRIIIIGSLTYDKTYKKYLNHSNTLKKQNHKTNKILILTSAINSGFCGPVASQNAHIEIISNLVTFIKTRKDLHFVIKPHPSYDHYELYRELRNFNLPNYIFDEEMTLSQAINNTSICILINYFTTATLDVLINNVPVIFLENAVYPLESWSTNDINQAIEKVRNIYDLEILVNKLLYDFKYKSSFIKKSSQLLNSILGETTNSAVDNFSNFINSLKISRSNLIHSEKSQIQINSNLEQDCINPINYFINGVNNKQFIFSFNFKIFRINSQINNYKYSTLLKYYIRGSNSGKSKENLISILYIMLILLFNIDLIFKINYINNKDYLKFFFRQLTRKYI